MYLFPEELGARPPDVKYCPLFPLASPAKTENCLKKLMQKGRSPVPSSIYLVTTLLGGNVKGTRQGLIPMLDWMSLNKLKAPKINKYN